ncbi:uncharacterized protein NPIL_672841 [Nephila pilipes]|uniref:Uncharacterized protein n=1 Tax=Nephila pilipes TaxID=299642 RepID=A0A8X6N812_NEPPI|nr:uncharacterized protein NPIL_672841 [Nephila pilipes]
MPPLAKCLSIGNDEHGSLCGCCPGCLSHIYMFAPFTTNCFIESKMMYKTFLLLLIGITAANAFLCPPNFCSTVKCQAVSCSANQIYKQHGSFCGCCPTCLNIIQKGGSCNQLLIVGEPARMQCAAGLYCNFDTATCESKNV